MISEVPVLCPIEHQAQDVFRVLLDCMAQPGKVGQLPVTHPDASDDDNLIAVLESLVDPEVAVWVCPGLAERIGQILFSRTRVRQAQLSQADYLAADRAGLPAAISGARVGTIEYPDEGATLIVSCNSLADGPVELTLSGPGVSGTGQLRVAGVPGGEFQALAERNSDFPLGLDLILVSWDGMVACIPRSTQIRVAVGGK